MTRLRPLIPLLTLVPTGLTLGLSGGCGVHTLLVEPGTPVRLAEPVEARVYVPDGAGHWVEGRSAVRLPAGWYALPPPPAPLRRTGPGSRPAP